MKKKVVLILLVVLLSLLLTTAALANVPDRGDPAGACPNANWTLLPLKFADPDQVAADRNLDGWLCFKKNPWTGVIFFIDNKY